MAYFLDFDERALKEWRKLGSTVREQLKRSWLKYLSHPGLKQTSSVVCLIVTRLSSGLQAIALYTVVIDEKVVVFVISVGKRERSEVYSEAVKRIL